MTEDDPFGLEEEVETSEDEQEVGANENFVELRKAYKRTERQNKALEKELSDLREFKQTVVRQQREGQLEQVFGQVGLSPKHAALFEKVNPEAEVTVEAVQAFAAEYDLATSSGESVEAPEEKAPGFVPVTTGSPGSVTMLDQEDVRKMVAQGDWNGLQKAYAEGRVNKPQVNWVTQD